MDIYNWIDSNILLPTADLVSSTSISKKYNLLMKSQLWNKNKLEEYRNQHLQAIIKHAYENVPYYHRTWKQLGIKPEQIKTTRDLKKIPMLTKDIIRNNYDDFKSNDFLSRNPKPNATGGSTGEPFRYWVDWEAYSYLKAATLRGWSWAGYNLGDKMVSIGGTSVTPKDKGGFKVSVKDNIIFRKKGFSSMDMGPSNVEKYLEEIKKIHPKFIRGYPSSLAILTEYLPRNFEGFSKLKAAFTTSEILSEKDRILIETNFGVEVFDDYGAGDGGIKAMECEKHQGLHLASESGLIELVKDNEEVAPGDMGTVLATGFFNYSFPFIRYEVGDSAIMATSECLCGRHLPLIKEVAGRTTDIIRFPDGTQWAGSA
ncbi:MAG: phenylacetate--CoA ligase family protein, partial [Candidatus Peribacteraceae bacterium]|nr:phenylacetate--CoA ligase family protein [Candidatus Peribacteraceae bacterium]